MKKMILMTFLSFLFFYGNNINGAYKDIGQNNAKDDIIHSYDKATGILKAYGYNKNGNLGTGNKIAITEENAVSLNSKVKNKKIIDYYFNYSNTYLLTEDGLVYASGNNLVNKYGNTTSFKRIYLYDTKNNKIMSFNGIDNQKKDDKKDSHRYGTYKINFKTQNKNVSHYFDNEYYACPLMRATEWYGSANCNGIYKEYIHYTKSSKNKYHKAIINKNNKKIYDEVGYPRKKYISKTYSNGVIKEYYVATKYKDTEIKYKKGKRFKKIILIHKDMKGQWGNVPNTVKEIVYKYNSKGYIYERMIYKYKYSYDKEYGYMFEHVYRYSKKEYKRNKNGELKSNKNGKAYTYITYFKKGQAKVTYKYDYSKKGKMVNKRVVKTRK